MYKYHKLNNCNHGFLIFLQLFYEEPNPVINHSRTNGFEIIMAKPVHSCIYLYVQAFYHMNFSWALPIVDINC